jgi:homoaconitase/3-isopropylmalate dehydratase large subunit
MKFCYSFILAVNAVVVPRYIVAFVSRVNYHRAVSPRQHDLFVTSLFASGPRTLYDKIWDDHLVDDDGLSSLIYVDRHLVHEVTSPQAFEGLRIAKRGVRRPDCTLVTVDHNVPTSDRKQLIDVKEFIEETASRTQVLQLETNVKDFGLKYFSFADERQGIVHIIGPEQGFTLPGCVTVCGDSHTATHGAFGALAFGIGTSEVEHVLATQVCSFIKSLVDVFHELSFSQFLLSTDVTTNKNKEHVDKCRWRPS